MDTKSRLIGLLLFVGSILIGAMALAGRVNFDLRRTNAAPVEQFKAIEGHTGPVNCPSPEWFTGRSDVQ